MTSFRKAFPLTLLSSVLALTACANSSSVTEPNVNQQPAQTLAEQAPQKHVVYQVFTRLFGNTNTTNKPWGTIEENGIGKFNDFTDKALSEIKNLGVTHIWYTGVPHHAVINDYTDYGIGLDDPDVVKGRAGSPYAVKDYYTVNPDLAVDPANRLAEFEALIERTHNNGLKVIIDIVPNHVARNYHSLAKPEGISDFGENDDTSVEYQRDNNFYYVVGEDFKVPQAQNGYQPLGGEKHPLADGQFDESPAKWTGNGSRKAQPDFGDWYETVKVNYGVRPDGSYDFASLPDGYVDKNYQAHYAFWQTQDVPDSWKKFKDIALYWTEKGVDGFRFDMAEMVPVEFWSYMNSAIKMANPQAFLLAEIYNPKAYRDYIRLGKMDYLYDKVDFYDTLKPLMQGKAGADNLVSIQHRFADIEHHLLHFLDNHDEQRVASPEFAGDADMGKPAMVVSSLISSSPIMVYFGQEVGEDGSEETGFGDPSRTTIFDYAGVPAHQRWMNNGQFDGAQLSQKEASLRDFYQRLLNFTQRSSAAVGQYADLHQVNRSANPSYTDQQFAFARFSNDEKLIVISNFAKKSTSEIELIVPQQIILAMGLTDGDYQFTDQLYQKVTANLTVKNGLGRIKVQLAGLESLVLQYAL
ncbi:alpha-amylase family protein [Catenovulum sp. 2E275]|uniref:alpha-amylase family protein n=1 Tax=Catenovulum sp. 2E275 TaxID=2980497 RepID=UPI0021D1502B|nr:alpha-amylase family protein [Catenovulum sp. 2E275]MCU4676094.1 alpha-amylase family protein [Catenovulum sp. 2E275]